MTGLDLLYKEKPEKAVQYTALHKYAFQESHVGLTVSWERENEK